jgi:TatD DNase family protein
MTIIDTHTHLYVEKFCEDIDQVVARAKQASVAKAILPNIDETTVAALKATSARYPDFFVSLMGLHPTSVGREWQKQLDIIYKELDDENCAGVGEIGIDLYWDTSFREEQTSAFEEQLRWSIEKNLPVAIHFRNAVREVIDSIKRVGAQSLRGVFHSFGGSRSELEAILALRNFSVGINGVITFKNSGLAETLAHCPREKVLLETDAPYLAPVPYRGKRNEPSYLIFVIKKLAEAWQEEEKIVAQITTRNALKMFDIRAVF